MNLSKSMHAGRSLLELLIIVAIGCVPVASGLVVMGYLFEKRLHENASLFVREAVYAIDRSLDDLHLAALRALPMADEECTTIKTGLQRQAALDLHIHSLSIIRSGVPTCSTVFLRGRTHTREEHASPIRLVFDDLTSPNAALVEYRLPNVNPGVAVTAYVRKLQDELRGFLADGLVLTVQVGDEFFWSDGDSRQSQPPSHSEHMTQVVSGKYGYTVKAGYPEGFRSGEIRQSVLKILPSLALVGLLTAAATYWGVLRKRVKRKRAGNGH